MCCATAWFPRRLTYPFFAEVLAPFMTPVPPAAEISTLWHRLARYAGGSVWVSVVLDDQETIRYHSAVAPALRQSAAEQPLSAQLHQAAAQWFEELSRRRPGAWGPLVSEAVYHRFQVTPASGAEAWREAIAKARGTGRHDWVLQLTEELLGSRDVDEPDAVRDSLPSQALAEAYVERGQALAELALTGERQATTHCGVMPRTRCRRPPIWPSRRLRCSFPSRPPRSCGPACSSPKGGPRMPERACATSEPRSRPPRQRRKLSGHWGTRCGGSAAKTPLTITGSRMSRGRGQRESVRARLVAHFGLARQLIDQRRVDEALLLAGGSQRLRRSHRWRGAGDARQGRRAQPGVGCPWRRTGNWRNSAPGRSRVFGRSPPRSARIVAARRRHAGWQAVAACSGIPRRLTSAPGESADVTPEVLAIRGARRRCCWSSSPPSARPHIRRDPCARPA